MLKDQYTDLVQNQTSSKGPDTAEDKVKFIPLLGTITWSVFWGQNTFQQIAQHLDMAYVNNWNNLLKPSPQHLKARWHILIKKYRNVSTL